MRIQTSCPMYVLVVRWIKILLMYSHLFVNHQMHRLLFNQETSAMNSICNKETPRRKHTTQRCSTISPATWRRQTMSYRAKTFPLGTTQTQVRCTSILCSLACLLLLHHRNLMSAPESIFRQRQSEKTLMRTWWQVHWFQRWMIMPDHLDHFLHQTRAPTGAIQTT